MLTIYYPLPHYLINSHLHTGSTNKAPRYMDSECPYHSIVSHAIPLNKRRGGCIQRVVLALEIQSGSIFMPHRLTSGVYTYNIISSSAISSSVKFMVICDIFVISIGTTRCTHSN